MDITIDQVLAKFPSDQFIQNRDEDALLATIESVTVETRGYQGITDENIRTQALLLHIAHCTRLELLAESTAGQYGLPTKIESRNDKLEYNNTSGWDFDSTLYGKRLQKLLNSLYVGGFVL